MFLSEKEYGHAVAVLSGKVEKTPFFAEVEQWFKNAFRLQLYDYYCDCTNGGLPRVRLLLWDRGCAGKMKRGAEFDEKKQRRIAGEFANLCRKYDVHSDYHRPQDVFVCYDTLKDEMQKRVLRQCAGELKALEVPDIWRVEIIFDRVHIFFVTDEQEALHRRDGVCGSVKREVEEIVKQKDVFGAFEDGVQCVFTSRQTLDEKYDGKMFYYTR